MIPAEARGAWREVEARLRPFVARRVARADVDDVVQETFVRVYRGLGSLTDGERFGAWGDEINAKVMKDPRVADIDPSSLPFDSKRMIFGGFQTLVTA